jgi:hypothetical protein
MQYLITCNPILYILIIILCAKKKEEGIEEERKITTKTNYGTVRIFVLNYYSGMAVKNLVVTLFSLLSFGTVLIPGTHR